MDNNNNASSFTFTFPNRFMSWTDVRLADFVKEIFRKDKLKSLKQYLHQISGSPHAMQTFQDRRYIEIGILYLASDGNLDYFRKFLDQDHAANARYETAEFLTIARELFNQLPEEKKGYFKGHLNSGLDNSLGLLSISHELTFANAMRQWGFSVDFPEYSGKGNFDLSATKNGNQFDIDCKVCGDDNGKFFKVENTDAIYQQFIKKITKNRAIFQGKIAVIAPASDHKGEVANKSSASMQALVSFIKKEDCNGPLRIQVYSFDDTLIEQVSRNILRTDLQKELVSQYVECIKRSDPDWALHPEWLFAASDQRSATSQFGLLFASHKAADWKLNIIRVAKNSLAGQLKGSVAPVIVFRLSDLSNSDIQEMGFLESTEEVREHSFLEILFAEIISNGGNALCGVLFLHRPKFRKTSVVDKNGEPFVSGQSFVKWIVNPSHPKAQELRFALGGK